VSPHGLPFSLPSVARRAAYRTRSGGRRGHRAALPMQLLSRRIRVFGVIGLERSGGCAVLATTTLPVPLKPAVSSASEPLPVTMVTKN
jgi:hypothetical protein